MNRFCPWCMYEIGPYRVGVSTTNLLTGNREWNIGTCSMVCARKLIERYGGMILWVHETVDGRPATAYAHPL